MQPNLSPEVLNKSSLHQWKWAYLGHSNGQLSFFHGSKCPQQHHYWSWMQWSKCLSLQSLWAEHWWSGGSQASPNCMGWIGWRRHSIKHNGDWWSWDGPPWPSAGAGPLASPPSWNQTWLSSLPWFSSGLLSLPGFVLWAGWKEMEVGTLTWFTFSHNN